MPLFSPKQIIVLSITILVLAISGSFLLGYKVGSGKTVQAISPTQRKTEVTQGIPITASHLVLGTIETISGQKITLKGSLKVPISASSTDQSARVTVTVTQATVIDHIVMKDLATINKERDAFLKKVEARGVTGTTTLTPPEPFTREKITINNLKVGDTIAVSTKEDILKLSSFTATKIEVQDKVIPPTPPKS